MPIRPAAETHAATIRALVRAERLDPTQLRWANFLVAEEDGAIVGIGQVRRHRDCRELGSLVVVPSYRGRGIGAALVAALEERAGFPLYLFCAHHTEPYYARLGYRRVPLRAAPPGLRWKVAFSRVALLAGIRVRLMRKDAP